jgi:hypothetical protein
MNTPWLTRPQTIVIGVVFGGLLLTAGILLSRLDSWAQVFTRQPQLDRTKPVPSEDEVIANWRKRQEAIATFRFNWVEQQTFPKGWVPNPRYPERERLNTPGLNIDRTYTVTKTLFVDGSKMRYSFEVTRNPEPDGVRIVSSSGDNNGLGEGRQYTYVSIFDGQTTRIRLSSVTDSPPPVSMQSGTNVDAQNLDVRPILIFFRPFDSSMGDLLLDRAVTNLVRTIYDGKSTFLLEEQRDPSGWKTIRRIEPERDFLISELLVTFEQKLNIDIHVDYIRDQNWGWIPSAWQVTQLLADGSKRLVTNAKVTSYEINQPAKKEDFE